MGFWTDFVEFCYSLVFAIRYRAVEFFIVRLCNARWMASGIGEGREIRIKEDIAIDRVKLKMERAWDR